MPYDAATMALVENALSDCFKFHSNLDAFLTRSGVPIAVLTAARGRAESRNAGGRFPKAPKRFVVQEVLAALADLGEGDRIVASIITGLVKSNFNDASPSALAAAAELKGSIEVDRKDRERRRERERQEREASARSAERVKEERHAAKQAKRDVLRDRFMGLMAESNAQKRGYLLEAFLNDFFEYEGLEPKGSFKLLGEQIDGSFAWRSRTCLAEAKWVKKRVAGAEFGAFNYKLEGKTVDTRGLYISVNGYSPEAIQGMNAKGALKFVCIDGAHLMRALLSSEGLVPILDRVWRHADETGESYLPVSLL
jgi:hypothetical protein